MKRVVVFGTTGSGKSWLAERLAERRRLRVVELDRLYWGRDWQPAPLDLFRHRVDCEIREDGPDDGWVVVGIYGQVRDLTWAAADTLVWLDLPLPVVMWQLVRRTVRRSLSREDLWGTGNRESFRRAFLSRHSILLWALRTHRLNRERFERACADLPAGKTVVRLRSRRDVDRFLAAA